MTIESVASISAIIGVFLALVALVIESRRDRFTLQTQVLLGLDERFQSSEIRALRQQAAANLIAKAPNNYQLSQVLDFLATIAFLYERKAIDQDLAYRNFAYWMVRYWLCSTEFVRTERILDPSGWMTLERTISGFVQKEKREGYPIYTDEILEAFLLEESGQFDALKPFTPAARSNSVLSGNVATQSSLQQKP